MKADVRVYHGDALNPIRVPIMEWEITAGLQHESFLADWAMAKESPERFKRCELTIFHRDGKTAHTWTILKGYVHSYRETEFPRQGGPTEATDMGNFVNIIIRGTLLHPEDYSGINVMTVQAGEAEAQPS